MSRYYALEGKGRGWVNLVCLFVARFWVNFLSCLTDSPLFCPRLSGCHVYLHVSLINTVDLICLPAHVSLIPFVQYLLLFSGFLSFCPSSLFLVFVPLVKVLFCHQIQSPTFHCLTLSRSFRPPSFADTRTPSLSIFAIVLKILLNVSFSVLFPFFSFLPL